MINDNLTDKQILERAENFEELDILIFQIDEYTAQKHTRQTADKVQALSFYYTQIHSFDCNIPNIESLEKLKDYLLLSAFAKVAYSDKNYHSSLIFFTESEKALNKLQVEYNLTDELLNKAVSITSENNGRKGE